ncbi:YadA C-terminal domain-containing protein, partial [Prochlorococcus sp. AH-716-J09]|nr:YadA C-terminal domain-containing protein [Prochlorococcus sp. AH-716-J09]
MKSSFKKLLVVPAVFSFLTPSIAKADLNIPAGTIHYLEQNNSIYMTGGTYNGKSGVKFETEASCSSTDYDSNALQNSIYNRACINRMIQTSGTSGIKLAPNTTDASVTIGSGTDATSINQSGVSVSGDYLIKHNSDGTIQLGSDSNDIDVSSEGLSVGGENLIKKSSDGVTSIGKNSLKLQESGGLQKMWATDANGNSIPIDITNGTKLLINGRDVEQSINNVGALSAALSGLPTVPTDSKIACGLGTGTHGGNIAFSGGCASKINEKVAFNAAASFVPGQDYQGNFEDTFSA